MTTPSDVTAPRLITMLAATAATVAVAQRSSSTSSPTFWNQPHHSDATPPPTVIAPTSRHHLIVNLPLSLVIRPQPSHFRRRQPSGPSRSLKARHHAQCHNGTARTSHRTVSDQHGPRIEALLCAHLLPHDRQRVHHHRDLLLDAQIRIDMPSPRPAVTSDASPTNRRAVWGRSHSCRY